MLPLIHRRKAHERLWLGAPLQLGQWFCANHVPTTESTHSLLAASNPDRIHIAFDDDRLVETTVVLLHVTNSCVKDDAVVLYVHLSDTTCWDATPYKLASSQYSPRRPTLLDRRASTKVNVHEVSMLVNPAAGEGPEPGIPIRSNWHQVYSEQDSTRVLLAEKALSSWAS